MDVPAVALEGMHLGRRPAGIRHRQSLAHWRPGPLRLKCSTSGIDGPAARRQEGFVRLEGPAWLHGRHRPGLLWEIPPPAHRRVLAKSARGAAELVNLLKR